MATGGAGKVKVERRLAAILAADIAGYSALMGADEEATFHDLKAHQAIVLPMIGEHGGRIIDTAGDGVLAEFASVLNAVKCAVAVQKTMAERNAGVDAARRMQFRVGVNQGDVVFDDARIYGDGVNVAARLEAIAEPGGICISAKVHDEIRGRIDIELNDMGAQQLKNIAEPVRVYQIKVGGMAGGDAAHHSTQKVALALPDKPSIAILPFQNMSGDAEQDYFADGMVEDITTALSRSRHLFVIARNSSFTYKGRAVDVKQVGRELGVRYVLEGSVRKAGNRVRITAQLIDGSHGGHLWAERYDRNLTDIFEIQDDVTQQIVTALKVTLSETEKSLIAGAGTKDVEAHDLFLKGRALMFGHKRDREMFDQSMACYRRAIELDPNYSGAYAGLAMGYALDHQNRWSDAPETSLDQAQRFVDEAIARDDKDAFAHYVATVVAMWKKDYERWASEGDRALSLNPNFALALMTRGILHIYTEEPEKAIPYIERALRLDPAPQHGQYVHFLGTAYFVAGEYEKAAACFRDRITINPTTDLSRAFLASALGHLGKPDEAHRVWREIETVNPRYSFEQHVARLPFRVAVDAEKFTDGLRKARLRE